MNKQLKYLFLLIFSCQFLPAQLINLSLSNACSQQIQNHLYCFGFRNSDLKIYKINSSFGLIDSLTIPIKDKSNGFLQISADTLHQYLNIYLLEKESKNFNVIRIDRQFNMVAKLTNVDVSRLNNTSVYGNNFLFFNETIHSIKSISDSSGTQFYLNKFNLKSEKENFDYKQEWQYPFERKNINHIQILTSNKNSIYLFVSIYKGLRAGEWLLNIDNKSGKLIKATKLNEKFLNETLLLGTFYVDKYEKSIHLFGQKFSTKQFEPNTELLSIGNASFASIYQIKVDSLGEIDSFQEHKIPINNASSGAKKISSGFIIKMNSAKRKSDNSFELETNILKNENSANYFFYCNSQIITLLKGEENYLLQKTVISSNPMIESYYRTTDKLNTNGKVVLEKNSDFINLYNHKFTKPISLYSKQDDKGNLFSILTKTEVNKNNINFSLLAPVNNIYQLKSLANFKFENAPKLFRVNDVNFVIGNQVNENNYQLNFYSW